MAIVREWSERDYLFSWFSSPPILQVPRARLGLRSRVKTPSCSLARA